MGEATHRTLATAGHVDHGKSTLVRALTGMEPDRLDEERRRGLTIELGYAWTDLADVGGGPVAFVDVPGHERLVRMMLAGAGTVPGAVFVVAADDGWSAQSSEHRDALDLLAVPAVAVAITKCDTVEEARVAHVAGEIATELAGTSLADAPVVATDGLTGRGIDDLRRVLAAGLAALPLPADDGRPRLWVDRAFSPPGVGTVVTGTLTGGALTAPAEVELYPSRRRARVRGLQALGQPVDRAVAGMRVAIDLAGSDLGEVVRGDAVVGGGHWRETTEADVWLRILPGRQVGRSGAWTLHAGTAAVGCRVLPLTGALEGPTEGAVRVQLDAPLPLVGGDRVVLREAGRRATVAGGRVADPRPGRRPRGTDARRRHAGLVAAAAAAPPAERPAALLRLTEVAWRPVADTRAAAGLPDAAPLPEALAVVRGAVVLRDHLEGWIDGMGRALGSGTRDRGQVVTALRQLGAPAAVADAIVDTLLADGRLVRAGGGLALREHAAAASTEVSGRAAALLRDLAARPFAPEPLEVVAARHGVDHRLLNALTNRGELVRAGGIAFAPSAVGRAVVLLAALEAEVGPFTAAQAKTAWDTTRRFAIPLLEHLDATGMTDFDGNLRRLTERGRQTAAQADQSTLGPS